MMLEAQSARRAKAFFERPAYRRMLQAVWKKYMSLGRIGGKAVLSNVSEAECESLNSFFGWNYRPGDTVEIPLILLEEELRGSAFAMGIQELHTLLEGSSLLTKREQQRISIEGWSRFFQTVRDSVGEALSPVSSAWLSQLENGQGAGSRTLRELYKTDRNLASSSLNVVVHALNFLFADDEENARSAVRLPVLSARCSGDAHALDSNQPAGRMLISVLRERLSGAEEQEEDGDTAMNEGDVSETLKLRDMYRSFGIMDDDLSSIVHWFVPEHGKPVLPTVWTLRQVESVDRLPRCSRIYIVENPAVFSTLMDSIQQPLSFIGDPPALLCTSGPASAAAIRWIQRCLDSSGEDCLISYSGDYDLKGLSMGETLSGLFPGQFTPWRFGSDTYQVAVDDNPGPKFDRTELLKLETMKVGWDHLLCTHMRQMRCKVHQETFVEELVKDFVPKCKRDS